MRLDPAGGGTRVHLASDSAWSAALLLTGLDTDFTVEAPDELTEHVRALVERWTRAAGPARDAGAEVAGSGSQPTAPPTSVPMP
jgi:hypothetical protein